MQNVQLLHFRISQGHVVQICELSASYNTQTLERSCPEGDSVLVYQPQVQCQLKCQLNIEAYGKGQDSASTQEMGSAAVAVTQQSHHNNK